VPSPDLSTEPEHAETAVAPTGRRWDPWVAVVGLVALVVYVAQGYGGILERDVAIYVYSAQQVLDGVPPYLGILNRAGPLAHLLPALGVGLGRLAGFDDLVGARILFTVFSAGCVSAVYLLGRDLFASRRAGIAAAATLLCFSGFIAYATFGPREKTPMVLFLTLALWAMTRRRWFSVGVFLSLATLILQIAFFVGAPALLLGLLLGSPRRDWLRNAGRLAVGGLVPLALHVVYFAAVGALREFVDAFWTINAQYTTPTPFTRNVDKSWASLDAGFGLSLYVAIFGLVALVALTVAAWVRRSGQPPGRLANLTALSAGAVGGAIWTMRDFDSWRDTFLLLPLSAIGVAGVLHVAARRLPVRPALAVTLVWCLAATAYAVDYSVSSRTDAIGQQRASVTRVLAALPDDATIVSIHAPQPLVLSGKRNPTRHQMFQSGLQAYVDDTWPGGLRGFQRGVVREEPDLIAIGRFQRRKWARAFGEDYTWVGCAPGWWWYARTSLGPEKIEDLTRIAKPGCKRRSDPSTPFAAGDPRGVSPGW